MALNEILIGWGLGVISGPIFNLATTIYNSRKAEKGIKLEFVELKFRLVVGLLNLAPPTKHFDKALLQWINQEYESYERYFPNSVILKDMKEAIGLLLADEKYFEMMKVNRSDSYSIPKYETPYLSVKLNEVANFSEKKQQYLLTVKRQLDILNFKNEELRKWDAMLFQSQAMTNSQILALQRNSQATLEIIYDTKLLVINEMNKFINECFE